jgi:hypothetical protein
LAAAAESVAASRGCESWEVTARWEDDERDVILLDVPALDQAAGFDIDAMPMFGGR